MTNKLRTILESLRLIVASRIESTAPELSTEEDRDLVLKLSNLYKTKNSATPIIEESIRIQLIILGFLGGTTLDESSNILIGTMFLKERRVSLASYIGHMYRTEKRKEDVYEFLSMYEDMNSPVDGEKLSEFVVNKEIPESIITPDEINENFNLSTEIIINELTK